MREDSKSTRGDWLRSNQLVDLYVAEAQLRPKGEDILVGGDPARVSK
jgi:hypothetical protein